MKGVQSIIFSKLFLDSIFGTIGVEWSRVATRTQTAVTGVGVQPFVLIDVLHRFYLGSKLMNINIFCELKMTQKISVRFGRI